MIGVNVGCGQTPTNGYVNFDNSLTVRASKYPFLTKAARHIHFFHPSQLAFLEFASRNDIRYANATSNIPLESSTVDVLYSSHMLEHLDPEEASSFLGEVHRVLRPGGTLRLAVPDIGVHVSRYMANGNADEFIERTHLVTPQLRSFRSRLRLAITGHRHHLWMYDGRSLVELLSRSGFIDGVVLKPGATRIADPKGLDLCERESESVYVEAIRP